MTDYYESETIAVTIALKVSWRSGDKRAKEHAMEKAQDIFVETFSGGHPEHGYYKVERV